jgi:uncharacterized protein
MDDLTTYTAFAGHQLIASADLETTLRRTKARLDKDDCAGVLIFDDRSGQQVDFDFRGTPDEVVARVSPVAKAQTGPGRPKLGVVSREVSLLPRHWEWLERQPSGASAALRRLVEEAKKGEGGEARARARRDAASRFMWAMAGNLPGFEEATRALFAGDDVALTRRMKKWPVDIRKHVERLLGT